MAILIGQVVAGLVLLVLGAQLLVKGASWLASRLGISPLTIGLTVVAFGTSAPELAANLTAALRGSSELAYGNVIGSNLFNIGVILGLACLVRPLPVESSVPRRQIPFLVGVTGLVIAFSALGSAVGRLEGAILLVAFVGMLVWSFRGGSGPDGAVAAPRARPVWRSILMAVAGLALLVAGAHFAVTGGVSLGSRLSMSPALVGLTIIAAGTSLPELATSVVAAYRGEVDIAVGNVVGSNLFNLGMVLATTSIVRPVTVPVRGLWDVGASMVLAALLIPFALTGRRLSRGEGVVLLVSYLAYAVWRLAA